MYGFNSGNKLSRTVRPLLIGKSETKVPESLNLGLRLPRQKRLDKAFALS